ncbi:MAG: deoxyribose-phosphate aldolase [Myxococcales bacterium]|nr:deoxyribose-phosphate aldolase [Myxococcales bacterium]
MSTRRVVLASDHGGFALKEALEAHLQAKGFEVLDVGTHSTESCDYPVFAREAAEAIARGEAWRGVIVDGAGIGSAMVANKVKGVRAGMAFDEATARNAREHNDAHVLTLGAGYLDLEAAKRIVDTFLATECTVERHQRRVGMIDALDGIPQRPTTRAAAMATGDAQPALVDRIAKVLSENPGLLQQLGRGVGARAGAPGNVCMTCNDCNHHCPSNAPDAVRSLVTLGGRVRGRLGTPQVPADIAKLIDHTLLRADATYAEIDQLCSEATEFGFASVCINPTHVRRVARRLRGSEVAVCTVIGFPLGATPKEVKALEARQALREGASELDMVLNIGALKSGDHQAVFEDIRLVTEVAHEGGALLKVIIETALLTDEEKVAACQLAKKARADFVKTSTGFSKGGATAHDVALMARAVEHTLEVKASGGVRSLADAKEMIAAGATRIGASVGIKIAREARGQKVAATAKTGY